MLGNKKRVAPARGRSKSVALKSERLPKEAKPIKWFEDYEIKPRIRVMSSDGTSNKTFDADQFFATYAAQNKLMLRNLQSNNQKSPTYSKYSKTDIVSYLENPSTNEANLRNMSTYLFNISNYYRRLIQYFAGMPTFSYTISPWKLDLSKTVNDAKLRSTYQKVSDRLAIMNIPHEFQQVLEIAFRDDVYYGYVWETKDSFMLQNLDPTYCKICGKEDGVFTFAYDFSYFDGYKDDLLMYPPEFTTKYNQYKSQGTAFRWQELDGQKSICIKINETTMVPIPPFVSLFSALADIEDYRAITKNASETNNYKMISLEIPVNDDGEFLIDYDLAKEFYKQLLNVLPENIGAILTPMKVSDWNFEKSGSLTETDLVTKAEASLWSQAGVNKLLFGGGEDPSSSTLELSTVNDQAIIFRVLRQIERWINKQLKQMSGSYKFRINLLDVTRFNKKEMHDQYLKDGQYGLPARSAIMATSDLGQTELQSMAYLENVVLNLKQHEVPLVSSNVQTSEGGRPTAEESGEKIGDAGEASREQR